MTIKPFASWRRCPPEAACENHGAKWRLATPQVPAGAVSAFDTEGVRRTGPSGERRPRSVLRSGYLCAAFVLDAAFDFACGASVFLRVFSFSDLATAFHNAFTSIL